MRRGRTAIRVALLLLVILIGFGWAAYRGFLANYMEGVDGVAGPLLAGRQAYADQRSEYASYYYDYALHQLPDDLEIRKEAFAAFMMNGDIDRAIILAGDLKNDAEVAQEAHIILVVSAIMKKQWAAARSLLAGFPDGPASRLFVPIMTAWIEYGAERSVTAAYLQPLLDPGPLMSVSSHQAALIYALSADPQNAERAFQTGVQSGAMSNAGFALDFGAFLEREGNQERAALLYDMLVQALPDHPAVMRAVARFKSGQKPPAFQRDIAPHLAAGFLSFADSLRRDGHSRFARSYVQLALYLAPSPQGQLLLADLAADQEQWDVAADLYAAVSGDEIYRRIALIRRAEMIEQSGDFAQALALLSPLAATHVNDEVVQLALADLYRRSEKYQEAAPLYQRAINVLSAAHGSESEIPWGIWFSLAMCQEQLGQWHDAERNLLRARDLSGNSPIVVNYLAYSWIDRGIRLDDAKKLIEAVVKKEPRNGFYVDSLGWLYFKLGEYEKALALMERASAMEPVDPVITDHLGDVLWYLSRTSEARYQWRKALAFTPDDDKKRKIDHKLLHGLPPLGQGGASI